MLGHLPYYHRTIRKYVVIFGSLFNDIFIVRETASAVQKERIKIPLTYAPKEKFLQVIQGDPTLTKSIQTTLPRMSFQMLSLAYDAQRQQQATIRHRAVTAGVNASTYAAQYMGVPYNFDFTLSLYVRNIEDGLQVVEQILPFFTPDYTLSARVSEEVDIIKDIPIILTSVAEETTYEGTLTEGPRMVTWDFQFTLKGYVFGPTSNAKVIMGVSANVANANANITGGIYVNLYDDVNNKTIQKFIVTGGSLSFRQGELVRESNNGITGIVSAWQNTTNTLYLSQLSGMLSANDNIYGMDTGAHWTIQTLETVNQKDVEIRIYQNPITANAESDYGYTTIITEWPNTIT